jgi:hypothetical protein
MPSEKELAALRRLLLAPEQEALRTILHRLDDPAIRATELATALPAALSLGALESAALVQALRPLVKDALAETLKDHPALVARGCAAALHGSALNPARWLRAAGRKIFTRRRRALPARLEQLYLVRRADHALVDRAARESPDDFTDPGLLKEQGDLLSMATYLLTTLREEESLRHYAALRALRIERFVFGIHADDRHLLLSVIHAPGTTLPVDELARCEEVLKSLATADPPKLPRIDDTLPATS